MKKKRGGQKKPVYGVGINNCEYNVCWKVNGVTKTCPLYKKWVGVMERCYSDKFLKTRPTYKGCTVCDEWIYFSNFKAWMEKQDWKGKQLDKDILVMNNKVYSPETCIFVTSEINKLLNENGARRGKYPQGVNFNSSTKGKPYIAQLRTRGHNNNLGRFKKIEEAEKVYNLAKSVYIKEVAEKQEPRLKEALIRWSHYYKNKPLTSQKPKISLGIF